jgi:8-oxo-dGTP diphosphatase
MTAPRLRSAVRAVILDPADRILLVRFTFPEASMWACPGGGIEDGESEDEAIVRELAEEAGLVGFTLGPVIWRREHHLPLFGGRWDGQVEQYYLVRTDAFEPMPRFSEEELQKEYVTGIRWWEPGELATSTERFAPRRLPELVAALQRGEVPDPPIDAGV